MAVFALDASVAISWCFPGDPTEDTPDSRHVLKKLAGIARLQVCTLASLHG
jgi:hypothetical protein